MPERSPEDRQMVGGMLQGMEHLIDACDAAATLAHQLIRAQRDGKPLASATVRHYEEQLAAFDEKKTRFRELLGQWWTLLDVEKH